MSQVQQFIAGQKILVTGFTGFLGKLFVTKLLSSCPDLHTLYVLVRKGDHSNVEDRISYILQSKVLWFLLQEHCYTPVWLLLLYNMLVVMWTFRCLRNWEKKTNTFPKILEYLRGMWPRRIWVWSNLTGNFCLRRWQLSSIWLRFRNASPTWGTIYYMQWI